MEKIKLDKKEFELLKRKLELFGDENDKTVMDNLFEEEKDEVDYKIAPFDLKLVNDFGCRVATKSGREVRIVCQDRKGNAPIVGLVEGSNNDEVLIPYSKDGVANCVYFTDENMDLVCLIKKKTIAAYVYEDEYRIPHVVSVNDLARCITPKTNIVDTVQVSYFPKH